MLKAYFGIVLIFLICISRVVLVCEIFSLHDLRVTIEACVEKSKDLKNSFAASSGNNREGFFGFIDNFRNNSINNIREYFPSPHSELILGMLLGIDELFQVPRFNDVLILTGTIHVVVVSGYNINLVYSLLENFIGGVSYKLHKIITAQILSLVYALITGFEPPIIRAWIFSLVLGFTKYFGRESQSLLLLFYSAFLMLIYNPLYLFSLSFQLSFLATLSLILYSPIFERVFSKFTKSKGVILQDFIATLAAQVLVLPLISYVFGRVSIVSPIVNALVLWTVPLATTLGGVFLIASYINSFLAKLMFYIVYPPLEIFIFGVDLFSNVSFASIEYSLSFKAFAMYYLIALALPYGLNKKASLFKFLQFKKLKLEV